MAGISMQALIARFQLSPDQLDKELSEEHLREMSRIIDDHNIVGPELGLSKAEMTAINSDARAHELQKMDMLRRWKQKFAWMATYRRLIEALLKCGRADTATTVCKLLAPDVPSEQPTDSASHSATSHPTHRDATTTGGTGRAPPPSAQLSPSLTTMSDSETKPRLAMKDMVTVGDYLFELDKEQIRTLGLILGLHSTTLSNKWESSRNDYLDDVLKAWLRRQDDVEEKGAPSWATLATALEHRRLQQNGIANKIKKERL